MASENTSEGPATTVDYSIPGMRVEVKHPPEPWALIVRSSRKQEDWVLHSEQYGGNKLFMQHVETIVVHKEKGYWIYEEEETESGWIYRMKLAPEGEPRRKVVELSAEKMGFAEEEKQEFVRVRRLTGGARYYEWAIGWLPARVQEKLSERWLFGPESASRANALVFFILSFLCVTFAIVAQYASAYGDPGPFLNFMRALLPFTAYLTLDGLLRHFHVEGSDRACGLFILEAIDRLYGIARGKNPPIIGSVAPQTLTHHLKNLGEFVQSPPDAEIDKGDVAVDHPPPKADVTSPGGIKDDHPSPTTEVTSPQGVVEDRTTGGAREAPAHFTVPTQWREKDEHGNALYRSTATLGVWLTVLLGANVLFRLILAACGVTPEIDRALSGLSDLWSFLFAVTIIVFCRWLYRSGANAHALRASGMRWTPDWVLIWFFLPWVTLFYMPYRAVKEIWQASDPSPEALAGEQWKQSRVAAILPRWWVAWLAFLLFPAIDAVSLTGTNLIYFLAILAGLPAPIFAILVVQAIHHRQEARFVAMQELVAAERLKSAPSLPAKESRSGIVAPEFPELPPELPAVQPAADADYSIP